MSLQVIEQFITKNLPNVGQTDNFGYRFFLYATDDKLPFVTFTASDNEYDRISDLNREGVFRVNIGVSGNTFKELFSGKNDQWDYTVLNQFMPHPDYAKQHFICILNPESNNLSKTLEFVEEAYLIAKSRFEKKQAHEKD